MKLPDRDTYVPIAESCIIGVAAGLSAVVLSAGVGWLGALRVHLSTIVPHFYVLPAFGLIGGLISGLLVETVAPEASGSGIPQVRARLDRITMPLNFRIALVKLLGGTIALGSGFFLGREGPTVQLGAAVAAPLTKWLPTTSQHKRQLIAAGAGAGLTAAFNAPLAGVMFVLEELLKEIKASTIMIAVVACSVSCLILNVISPPHLRAAVDKIAPSIYFDPVDLPFYLLLGVVAGVLGAVFNGGILGALNFNRNVLRIPVTLKVGLAGLLSGAIIALMPEAFHNYAGMRALIIAGQTDYQMVILAFLEFYLLTLIGYGSGAPGGLFAPSLALGSAIGYLVGYFEQTVMGTGSTATFALVGMGAFFAGVARTPLTAVVITFELTTNFALLTPLMLSCVLSTAVAELVSKGGLYDHLMRWNGIHLQGPGSNNLRTMKAQDVMHKHVDAFASKLLIKDVLSSFAASSQRGFPVVDKGVLVGVVTQTDLAKLGQSEALEKTTIADIMTARPVAVNPFDSLEDILFLFSHHKFTWLPVIYHEKFRGIILQSDVLNALFTADHAAETATAKDNPAQGNGNEGLKPETATNTPEVNSASAQVQSKDNLPECSTPETGSSASEESEAAANSINSAVAKLKN